MSKRSPLTDQQWDEIWNRYLHDEPARALAREFGINEAAIRQRFATQKKQIKAVADQVITAEEAFHALPAATQVTTQSLINELRAISYHLAGAARLGSMTAHRLAGIANQQVNKIGDADPLSEQSITAIKGIAVLTDTANKAARTGISLLNANKDRLPANRDTRELGDLSDEELRQILDEALKEMDWPNCRNKRNLTKT